MHCDKVSRPTESVPKMEHEKFLTATNEVDLPNFLNSDVVIWQPVGTLSLQPACFMGRIES